MRYILVKKNFTKKVYELIDHWNNFDDLIDYLYTRPTSSFTALYGTSGKPNFDKRTVIKLELEERGTLRDSGENNIIIDLKSKLDEHYLDIIKSVKPVYREIRLDEILKDNGI